MPKGSDSGLLDKLFELAGTKHPSLRRPPRVAHGFVLRHFAGEVTYDAEGFLSKNKERYTSLSVLHHLKTRYTLTV